MFSTAGLDSEDGVRKEAWPFLTGVYAWDSSTDERHAFMNKKRDEYVQLKGAWWDRMIDGQPSPEQEEWWKEQKSRIGKSVPCVVTSYHSQLADLATRYIEKDVHRTDRHIPLFAGEDIPHPDPTSPFYQEDGPGTNVHMEQLKDMLLTYLEYDTPPSPDSKQPKNISSNPHPLNLGYVQGMSDLLSTPLRRLPRRRPRILGFRQLHATHVSQFRTQPIWYAITTLHTRQTSTTSRPKALPAP